MSEEIVPEIASNPETEVQLEQEVVDSGETAPTNSVEEQNNHPEEEEEEEAPKQPDEQSTSTSIPVESRPLETSEEEDTPAEEALIPEPGRMQEPVPPKPKPVPRFQAKRDFDSSRGRGSFDGELYNDYTMLAVSENTESSESASPSTDFVVDLDHLVVHDTRTRFPTRPKEQKHAQAPGKESEKERKKNRSKPRPKLNRTESAPAEKPPRQKRSFANRQEFVYYAPDE